MSARTVPCFPGPRAPCQGKKSSPTPSPKRNTPNSLAACMGPAAGFMQAVSTNGGAGGLGRDRGPGPKALGARGGPLPGPFVPAWLTRGGKSRELHRSGFGPGLVHINHRAPGPGPWGPGPGPPSPRYLLLEFGTLESTDLEIRGSWAGPPPIWGVLKPRAWGVGLRPGPTGPGLRAPGLGPRARARGPGPRPGPWRRVWEPAD